MDLEIIANAELIDLQYYFSVKVFATAFSLNSLEIEFPQGGRQKTSLLFNCKTLNEYKTIKIHVIEKKI